MRPFGGAWHNGIDWLKSGLEPVNAYNNRCGIWQRKIRGAVALGKGPDRPHHALVLVQRDVAVVDPAALEIEKPGAHGDLTEWRHVCRVLAVTHGHGLPVDGDDLEVVDV